MSTNASSGKKCNKGDGKLKKIKEINLSEFVNKFTFSLYQNGLLDEWKISKKLLRSKFLDFCHDNDVLYEQKKDPIIGSILSENQILHYSSKPGYFCLKFTKIYEYENSILEEFDKEQINKTENKIVIQPITDQIIDDYEVDINSNEEILEFESCIKTTKNKNFIRKMFSCYICQINFESPDNFEEHIHKHNDISDFEWLKQNPSNLKSNFEIFYKICRNPFYLKLTLKTEENNIYIDRIITIKSNSITTLKKIDENCNIFQDKCCSFIVDRHVFNKDSEQPIVIIYHMDNLNEIFIEHYFMRLIEPTSSTFCKFTKYISKRVPRRTELGKGSKFKSYYPTNKLKDLCKRKNVSLHDLVSYDENFYDYFKNKNLSKSNASHVLKYLLQLEDVETENFYSKLTQYQAAIKGFGADFSVKIGGKFNFIIEDVLKSGDEVILKIDSTIKNNSKFFGKITRVYGTTVCFEIRKSKYDKLNVQMKYTVSFRPNRRNFQYQYFAIEKLEKELHLQSFLFPTNVCSYQLNSPALPKLDIVNESVKINPEQEQAVMNIVCGVKNVPYIIVGPPGTGKTTTVVESILQVKLVHPMARILITAGSNAACDEVAKRVLKLIDNTDRISHIKLLRLYAKSAEKRAENTEEILIESSNLAYGDHFYPSLEVIGDYDIIVCTLSVVGRLKSSGMSQTFFSYCFIDECAASTESEALICISAVYHSSINIIIAGDPKQLGPILHSKWAAEFGLQNSLMDRLLKYECYQVNSDKSYNRRIQTRLVRNFRTHKDILEISNRLFYSNELIPSATPELTNWALNWQRLPNKNVPIIFNCVDGYTKKDKYSTSLYNSREVGVVMDYVKRIMYFEKINGRQMQEEDIGIISPYKKQNIIIREELDKRNWYKIATGSVETFQGQEKPVIIISTVRSIRSDKSGFGFLDNEKRLNVMLTRAQALLIVVGNPYLLSNIPKWNETIDYFKLQNTLTGGCKGFANNTYFEDKNATTCTNRLKNLELENNLKNTNNFNNKSKYETENWIEENKKMTHLVNTNMKIENCMFNKRSESDIDTISIIPEPPSNELFNNVNEGINKNANSHAYDREHLYQNKTDLSSTYSNNSFGKAVATLIQPQLNKKPQKKGKNCTIC